MEVFYAENIPDLITLHGSRGGLTMRINNPLFHADMPDPDVIRVGEDFYMVSTTMFYMPAAPVLKSKDLLHWEIVSYICTEIAGNDIYQLKNGRHAYGKGQWATSLMYREGRFYACFVCHDMKKTYLFSTDDIEKSDWDRTELDGVYHDMSFLCWEERVYLVYGNGEIRLVELKKDFTGIVEQSDRLLFQTPSEGMRLRCEGCRAYVKDGWIYLLFIEWPTDTEEETGIRREVCYRSRNLFGPYERRIVLQDNLWLPGSGIAQGALFDDMYGNWYAMMFQDSRAVGRVPFLMPVSWVEAWPVIGTDGKVPESIEVPFREAATEEIIQSDSFSHTENMLKKEWQWNHAPDNIAWSYTERPGYLRLKNRSRAKDLFHARNTLTQRTSAPYCKFTVNLDCNGMEDGDYAGLCVMQEKCGQIGVRQRNGRRSIVMLCRDGERAPFELTRTDDLRDLEEWYSVKEYELPFHAESIWLRIVFRYDSWGSGEETAEFFYSLDGVRFCRLEEKLELFYSLSVFVGARVGIFSYNDERDDGGVADFRDFTMKVRDFHSMDGHAARQATG